jgi:hypothetical protein
MREIRTSGSMSGDGKRSVAGWPKLLRPSSTLPSRQFAAMQHIDRCRREADIDAAPTASIYEYTPPARSVAHALAPSSHGRWFTSPSKQHQQAFYRLQQGYAAGHERRHTRQARAAAAGLPR